MKDVFIRLVLVLIVCLNSSGAVFSQTSAGYQEVFAFEVKQIDEFFERFNNQQTLIKNYIAARDNTTEVNREELIKNLFNGHSTTIRVGDVYKFIESVNNPQQPVVLSFYDDEWFAKVKCSVLYQQKKRELVLVLRVQKEKDGASKWVIHGVDADFFVTPDAQDPKASLNPISHGTDFLGLSKAFTDTENIRSYLPADYQEDQLSKFILEIRNKRLSFVQVESISYHLLQIDGWILTVENFQRPEKNSGWLISDLIQADTKAKENYKQQILKLKI
ncbi:hypothetical protein [Cesiribacter sp. SM1]|uniref:hypothetical protein n=1 Tax=Cesiribacter sp. SM1 TaxID=2861196 RepID=UPI001CD73E0E|nr:hypothetical protein [Cesiribacter sp. SM1]